MKDIDKKIKEIDDAIRIAENPLNTAPGGEIAGRGYVIDRLNECKELLKEQKAEIEKLKKEKEELYMRWLHAGRN